MTVNGSTVRRLVVHPARSRSRQVPSAAFSGTGSGGHGEGRDVPPRRQHHAHRFAGRSVGTDGNATITSLGIPKSAGDGPHSIYALGDAAYLPSQASAGIVIDTTAPVMSAQLYADAGRRRLEQHVSRERGPERRRRDGIGRQSVQVHDRRLRSEDIRNGPGLCGIAVQRLCGGTTTVKYFADDVAGNSSAVQTQLVKIDTTPPTNAVSLTGVSGGSTRRQDRSRVAAPSITAELLRGRSRSRTQSPTRCPAQPRAPRAPSRAVRAAGRILPSLVTTPAGGPYVSAAFSWSSGLDELAERDAVTGRDVADQLRLDHTQLHRRLDRSERRIRRRHGARRHRRSLLDVHDSQHLACERHRLGIRAGDDRSPAAACCSALVVVNGIAAGSCGSYGGYAQVGSNDPSSPYADNAAGGITTGHCYRYEYVVSNNVGNTTTYTSPDVMVDTTGPSAPSLSLSSATGNTYINGTTAYINAQAGKSGSFQATATSTDNDSGLLKVNFPAPPGFSSGGGDSNSSPTRPPTTGRAPSQPQAHKQPPPTTTPTSPTLTPSPSHPTQPAPTGGASPSTAPTQPAPAPPATTRAATGRSARSATTPTPAPDSPPRS